MEKKTARKALESMRPDPEKESPRRSWLYIFLAVFIIFGLTFLFQKLDNPTTETIDPYNFDQLKDQVQEMRMDIETLKKKNDQLEKQIENLQ